MKRPLARWPCIIALALAAAPSFSEEDRPVKLPPPQFETAKTLMQALRESKSTREFGAEKLDAQTLGNLLWAAFGVNRPETGGRTAPSTHNWQQIDIYVATADGLYVYDAKAHALNPVLSRDIRALTGTQDFAKDAPVNLVYVADFSRRDAGGSEEDRKTAAAADAGFIGENVYLYCAAAGLAAVVRGSLDADALAQAMRLKPTQRAVLAQSVGRPKK